MWPFKQKSQFDIWRPNDPMQKAEFQELLDDAFVMSNGGIGYGVDGLELPNIVVCKKGIRRVGEGSLRGEDYAFLRLYIPYELWCEVEASPQYQQLASFLQESAQRRGIPVHPDLGGL